MSVVAAAAGEDGGAGVPVVALGDLPDLPDLVVLGVGAVGVEAVGVDVSGAGAGALVPPAVAVGCAVELVCAPAFASPPEVITAVDVAPITSTTVIAITARCPPALPGKSGLRSPSTTETMSAHATSSAAGDVEGGFALLRREYRREVCGERVHGREPSR